MISIMDNVHRFNEMKYRVNFFMIYENDIMKESNYEVAHCIIGKTQVELRWYEPGTDWVSLITMKQATCSHCIDAHCI